MSSGRGDTIQSTTLGKCVICATAPRVPAGVGPGAQAAPRHLWAPPSLPRFRKQDSGAWTPHSLWMGLTWGPGGGMGSHTSGTPAQRAATWKSTEAGQISYGQQGVNVGPAIFPEQPSYPQEQGSSRSHTEGSPHGHMLSFLPLSVLLHGGLLGPDLRLPPPWPTCPGPSPRRAVSLSPYPHHHATKKAAVRPPARGLAQVSSHQHEPCSPWSPWPLEGPAESCHPRCPARGPAPGRCQRFAGRMDKKQALPRP